ncbi:MAG TPA: histidine kinase dimerization/phosphoacceptor domain -containing protein [Candidatus Limnocylindrales bacterium]|nr:histidine kinase dimerization/phosphoacceptor domain -containing protein [Candidatus Limnocylindrales bacterium]
MPVRDPVAQPTPDLALAMLQQLADVFLRGGVKLPAESAATQDTSDNLQPAMLVVTADGAIVGVNPEAERLLGVSSADAVGRPAQSLLGKVPAAGERLEARVARAGGGYRSLWVSRSDIPMNGAMHAILVLHEQDLMAGRRTELRYRHLVEQIPAVVFTAGLDGGLYDIYVSPQIETLLGYSQAEWVANPVLWYDRLHYDDRRKLDAEFARGCITGGPFRSDCRFLTRDDKVVWVHGEARLIKDARGVPVLLQGVAFDISETKRAEEIARASLREKETLLKEIHHRVKNNLQVTSSLLKLQSERVLDESARTALREGQGRIRSMALVHELLYQSKDLSSVDLGDYIRDLTRQLLRSHARDSVNVRVENRVIPVPLPIDVAVPCGLILNELVSNALKHAFPDDRPGTIWVGLEPGADFDDLVVRDDGVGIPPGVDLASGATLGIRLIRTLADQIDGRLSVRTNGGTEVRLSIPRRLRAPA